MKFYFEQKESFLSFSSFEKNENLKDTKTFVFFSCFTLNFEFFTNFFKYMKNISSSIYLKKNTSFFQNLFKTSFPKKEFELSCFQNFKHIFSFQFLKPLFQKKQQYSLILTKSLSIQQTKRKLSFQQKICKAKEFCFSLLSELFFICGISFEKFQFFFESFLFNFLNFSFKKQKSFFEIEKNPFFSQFYFLNFDKFQKTNIFKENFQISFFSFFFFFVFEKQINNEKNSFFQKNHNKKIFTTNFFSVFPKRTLFKSMFRLFQIVSKNFVENFFVSFSQFSKKKLFHKIFEQHSHFFYFLFDLSNIFPFISRGFLPISFQASLTEKRKKFKIHQFSKKKTYIQSFFDFFNEFKPKIVSFYFKKFQQWFFEKKFMKNTSLSLNLKSSNFSHFNFFSFYRVEKPKRFSFFSKNLNFSLPFFLPLKIFLNTLEQIDPSLIRKKNSKDFSVSQIFSKSFFHIFQYFDEKLFEKIQILFFGNFLNNFELSLFKIKTNFLATFEKKHKIQQILFAFQILFEKTCSIFPKTKILLSLVCQQFFEHCVFWKSYLFCYFPPEKFSQNFENFFHIFLKIHEQRKSQLRFQFFEKEKIQNFLYPFIFLNSVFLFQNFSFQENKDFEKNFLFFPKKSSFRVIKTDWKTYECFPFLTAFSIFLRFFKKKSADKRRRTFFFYPLKKALFSFKFENSLFFLIFQLQSSFQGLLSLGKIPHRNEVKTHIQDCKQSIIQSRGQTQLFLMKKLHRKISLWCKENKSFFSKEILKYCDYLLLKILWKWAQRRHPNKNKLWIQKQYFHCVVFNSKRKWLFGKKRKGFLTCIPLHSNLEVVF